MIIREAHLWTDEDAVLELEALVQQGVVLHLAVVAQPHPGAHVDARADNAPRADHRLLANVGLAPDARARADGGIG